MSTTNQQSLKKHSIFAFFMSSVLMVIFLSACNANRLPQQALSRQPSHTLQREACQVLVVFDGDTVGCDLNGNGRIDKPRESIRFLGIDAPETRYSKRRRTDPKMTGRDEPFAVEAKTFVTQKLRSKTIYLVYDRQRHDRFGRTLAFIYETPDTEISINESLLRQGLVTTLFIKPNGLFQNHFEEIEAQARISQQGLWKTRNSTSFRH